MSAVPAAPVPQPPRAPAAAGRAPTAPGYRPGRTLRLRVEARRQLRRRRTMIVGALLAALPFILMAAFAIGGTPTATARNGPTLIDTATASGANFAATCLFVSAGFVLVVPVALFCGDTVASEAGWSSLRYLLAAPVPRARLLAVKLTVALGFSAVALVLLPAVALVAGTVAYGWGDLELPTGGALPAGERAAAAGRRGGVHLRRPAGHRGAGLLAVHGDRRAARRGRRRGRPDHRRQRAGRGDRAATRGGTCCPRTGSSPGPTRSSRPLEWTGDDPGHGGLACRTRWCSPRWPSAASARKDIVS